MVKKVVFISSTYEDLADHRQAVWQVLKDFNVVVRGMEEFGARTEAPLQTCLAEVEQSDVYVGIVAFRAGSLETASGKSFTQLEYEHALQLKKEILIYLADEEQAKIRYKDIDIDESLREKLKAFKGLLRERHTVNTFSVPDDLAEKLRRDFVRYFEPIPPETEQPKDEFDTTLNIVQQFLLVPKSVLGREARFRVSFHWKPYPASRSLCRAFNLDYGLTIGINVTVEVPKLDTKTVPFNELYATGPRVNKLLQLIDMKTITDLYARVQFSEEDVPRIHGLFFGDSYYDYEEPSDDPHLLYVSPEGKAILLFSKPAPVLIPGNAVKSIK